IWMFAIPPVYRQTAGAGRSRHVHRAIKTNYISDRVALSGMCSIKILQNLPDHVTASASGETAVDIYPEHLCWRIDNAHQKNALERERRPACYRGIAFELDRVRIACVVAESDRTGSCSTNDYAGGPAREDYILSRAVSAIAR